MKKLLVVDSCAHCIYRGGLLKTYCNLADKPIDMEGQLVRIPSWCPLPDAKEE